MSQFVSSDELTSSVETRNFYPSLTRNSTTTSSGSKVVSYSIDHGTDKPIIMLIHGYPQSAFEWRTVSTFYRNTFSANDDR